MKTGNKIALFYTAITSGIVLAVVCVFYFLTTHYITNLYYSYLIEKAYATAEKHWEKDEADSESYERIQKHYKETLPSAKEILLNADSAPQTRERLLQYLTPIQVNALYKEDIIKFTHRDSLGAALYYPDNEGNFIVLILSTNHYGKKIQEHIGWFLLLLLCIIGLLIFFIGKLYAIRMIDRIDAAYHSEKAFISNASHELNNPLTAIQGECEITLLKERSIPEYQSALQRIDAETKRIIQMMKHLLFLSHGNRDILEEATESVNLPDFLRQFASDQVSVCSDNRELSIHINPYLLKIALQNILNNACKYSDGKPVRIELHGHTLRISDEGIGIPAKELKSVYQPFYRAENTREYAGQGIGLSLSKRIFTTYGATMEIHSEEHKGTTVTIKF